MIGYMKPEKSQFNKEQRAIYQSTYCGLCRHLKYKYGVIGTLALNYEIVDLLLLIESVKIEKPTFMKRSCSLTPFIWKDMKGTNEEIYVKAAEIIIIIAELEIQDNILDDNKFKDRIIHTMISPQVKKVRTLSPLSYNRLETVYSEYMTAEQKARVDGTGFNNVVGKCGLLTKCIASLLTDELVEDVKYELSSIMELWGEWIYLMDAVEDLDDDVKNGRYNPWILHDSPKNKEEVLVQIEQQAWNKIKNMSIIRYEDILEALFRVQLPERRKKLLAAKSE